MKRIALVFAVVTMLAMVLAPVAMADENEAGWWGNVVGYPYNGSPICLTAVDGSMVNNCHAQDPLRPYEPVKFDGIHPGLYIATSGPAKAFVYSMPGQDNWVDWAWSTPGWWHSKLPVPAAPAWHMWHPGGEMTHGGPKVTEVTVEQNVNVTGSGTAGQSVEVKSPGPSNVTVNQNVTMQAAKTIAPAPVKKAPACFTYTVKYGDMLSRIAVKYGDTVAGLVARNHIKNASKIYAGQRITVCDP
jgi:LysM repeat protein